MHRGDDLEMMSMKKRCGGFVLFIGILVMVLGSGCGSRQPEPTVEDVVFHSTALDKDMKLKVYLPPGYNEDSQYPVLYFLPDYGGSSYAVMEQYETAQTAERMINEGILQPLIIVGVQLDASFGINSADKTAQYTTPTDKTFGVGRYEDYLCNEVIALVDERYSTIKDGEGRFIGGYSMGGFAALHAAFRHPGLFSRVGGHSPSLFLDEFADANVSDWLYPTAEVRSQRDPIWIARENDIGNPVVFLDEPVGGSEAYLGIQEMIGILEEKGIAVEYRQLGLSHSRATCAQNMETYLLFYAGKEEK